MRNEPFLESTETNHGEQGEVNDDNEVSKRKLVDEKIIRDCFVAFIWGILCVAMLCGVLYFITIMYPQMHNDHNTTVTLIGTGSGTPDISFVMDATFVDYVVGDIKLSSSEPKFLHDGQNKYVMGFRGTLLTSSSLKHQNGYLPIHPEGLAVLYQFLQMVPLKDTVYTHIYERMEEMKKNDIHMSSPTIMEEISLIMGERIKYIHKYMHMHTSEDNCTVPVVGPDSWMDTIYDVPIDDCGYFTGVNEGNNNCYAYGTNIATNTFPQPGRGSGHEWDNNTCSAMIAAAQRDGLTYIGEQLADLAVGPGNGHYVALYIWPNTNFHWARMDYNGTYNYTNMSAPFPRRWSHKPGGTPVQITDNNGNCIGNIPPCVPPSEADLSPWTEFCGYMSAIPSQLTID